MFKGPLTNGKGAPLEVWDEDVQGSRDANEGNRIYGASGGGQRTSGRQATLACPKEPFTRQVWDINQT